LITEAGLLAGYQLQAGTSSKQHRQQSNQHLSIFWEIDQLQNVVSTFSAEQQFCSYSVSPRKFKVRLAAIALL